MYKECKRQKGWRIPSKQGFLNPQDKSSHELTETEAVCEESCTGLYHVLCVNIMVYSLVLFLLLLFLIFLFVLFCFFLFLSVEQVGLCYMCLLLGSFILLVLSNSDVRYLSIDLLFIPTTLFSPFCQFLPQSPHLSPLSPFLFRKG